MPRSGLARGVYALRSCISQGAGKGERASHQGSDLGSRLRDPPFAQEGHIGLLSLKYLHAVGCGGSLSYVTVRALVSTENSGNRKSTRHVEWAEQQIH